MSARTSIVIVTHNRPHFLGECLASCAEQTDAPHDYIVIVNPADEASESVARKHGAKIIRTHRNLGFFPALNIGIANASADRIMVIDDDARFDQSDALARLSAHLDRHADCAIVTCNIRGPCEGEPFPSTCRVPLFKTGFALFRREVFTEWVGFVPDKFFRAGGELYLCNYLYERGWHVTALADVWMYHAQTATGRSHRDMNFYAVRNHALIAVLQEPAAVVPVSLLSKLASSFLRVAFQRRDFMGWASAWLSLGANLIWATQNRKAISWSTYRTLRKMRQNTGRIERPIVRPSDDGHLHELPLPR